MNFQTTIGTLLISSAIALTGIWFRPAFQTTTESVDQPSISSGFKEIPRRLNYLSPAADPNLPVVAAQQTPPPNHPPIVGPSFVSADPIPAPIPKISVQSNFAQANSGQTNFDQTNFDQAIRIQDNWSDEKSVNVTPERATQIPPTKLPGWNEDPNTAPLAASPRVSQPQALSLASQPSRSVPQVQQLSLIHISEPTRPERISYAVFCLKKKN